MRMLLNEFLDLEIKQLNFEEKNLHFAHENTNPIYCQSKGCKPSRSFCGSLKFTCLNYKAQKPWQKIYETTTNHNGNRTFFIRTAFAEQKICGHYTRKG